MTTADMPTDVQLDAATAEFITGVTSMSIATRDARLLPTSARRSAASWAPTVAC